MSLLLIIILTLFAGSRLNIDNDYSMYYEYFAQADATWYKFLHREVTVEWTMYFIPTFWNYFIYNKIELAKVCFLTFAFLGVSTKITAIRKYSSFFFLSIMLYVSNLFIMQEMTTIRAGVASGIFLLTLKDLERNDNVRAIVKITIAFLFHTSSILFVLVWFLLRYKIQIKYYYYLIIISFGIAISKLNLLTLFFLDRFFLRVYIYSNKANATGEIGTNLFNFRLLFALGIIVLFGRLYSKLIKYSYFENLFRIHILSVSLFYLLVNNSPVFSLRSFELLSVVQIILYPMIVYVLKRHWIGWIIIILYSFLQIYYFINVVDIYKPYRSWLF